MSRGGRGYGRHGAKVLPFVDDPGLKPTTKPSELFPEYRVPTTSSLTSRETRQVSLYLYFREQVHDGPFYTHSSISDIDAATTPTRAYGQSQINQRYGIQDKAAVDPFNAMPKYSVGMLKPPRRLADLRGKRYSKRFFPKELHATLDGHDGRPAPAKRKRPDGPNGLVGAAVVEDGGRGDEAHADKALEAIDQIQDPEAAETVKADLEEPEIELSEEDDDFDDEDDYGGGDYDAEKYFENGADDDEMGDDEGGGDDEGAYS